MLSAALLNTESSLLHMNCLSGWRSFNSEEMVINTCIYFRLCSALMPTGVCVCVCMCVCLCVWWCGAVGGEEEVVRREEGKERAREEKEQEQD